MTVSNVGNNTQCKTEDQTKRPELPSVAGFLKDNYGLTATHSVPKRNENSVDPQVTQAARVVFDYKMDRSCESAKEFKDDVYKVQPVVISRYPHNSSTRDWALFDQDTDRTEIIREPIIFDFFKVENDSDA